MASTILPTVTRPFGVTPDGFTVRNTGIGGSETSSTEERDALGNNVGLLSVPPSINKNAITGGSSDPLTSTDSGEQEVDGILMSGSMVNAGEARAGVIHYADGSTAPVRFNYADALPGRVASINVFTGATIRTTVDRYGEVGSQTQLHYSRVWFGGDSISGLGTSGTPEDDLDKIYNTPPCDVAKFDELSEAQKVLIGGGEGYNGLSPLQKAVFVNLTGALLSAGANLDGLKLQKDGVLNDRLFFTPGSTGSFKKSIQALAKSTPKVFDSKGALLRQFGGHSGMKDYMVRQTVAENSLQIGFGKNGAYVDIDLWNPDYEQIKHWEEIGKNDAKKGIVTPHFYLAKVLGNCKN